MTTTKTVGARRARASTLRICCAIVVPGAFAAVMAPRPALALSASLCSTVTCTGGTPQITNNGSAVTHGEVVPIFWGTYWNSPTAATRGQVVGGVQHLLNGPYLGAMSQYDSTNGVGPARMAPVAPIDTATIPTGFDTPDFQREVNKLIGQGAVPPPPAAGATMLYTVFLPPDSTSTKLAGAYGFNVVGTCDSTCGSAFSGHTYRVLGVFPGSGGPASGYVQDFSHELAEAITENVVVTNCTYNNTGTAANQIADLCSCAFESQLGGAIALQAYWSQADGACVIPEGWSGVYQWTGSGQSWTWIGGAVRQIYAGGDGLIATDLDDNLTRYTGTPGSWTQIGGPGAMFSVGASWILALTPDTGGVVRFDNTSWTSIGGASSAVYSGGFDLATDYGGNPYEYLSTLNTWTKVGTPGDQFVVGDTWAAGLDFPHTNVSILPGAGSSWISTGHAASELFIGDHMALAARDLTAGGGVSAMTTTIVGGVTTPQPWRSMGGAGNTFALFGSSQTGLVGLTPVRNAVFHETAAIESPPASWTQIGGAAGRLVGGGASLFATGGVQY